MIKTAVLLPAGAQVMPEEILIDDYQNIQAIVGGNFDVVRFNGEMDNKQVALCGYVHDEGLLIGLEMNYLASMLFSQIVVGPCVVTFALSPNGEYDGDDYDMPSELIMFLKNDLLLATAAAYNESAMMAFATAKMVSEGKLTEDDVQLAMTQIDEIVSGERESMDAEAEMVMLMVQDYLSGLETELEERIMGAVKDVVRDMMIQEDNDGDK